MDEEKPVILIVDDEELMRLKLKRFVEQEFQAQTLLAADGEQAWQLYSTHDVRFIISDWMMPGCDGPELCARIRQNSTRPYTYFVLLTGKTDQEDLLAGMSSGADDYLRKPVDYDELRSRLVAGLRVLELERSLSRKNLELSQTYDQLRTALSEASAAQRRMLPTRSQLELASQRQGLRLAYNCQFCESLGGDVLGIGEDAVGGVCVFLADVSGHGIAASVSAVSLHTYLQTIISTTDNLHALVEAVNQFCCREFPEAVYCSLVLVRISAGASQVELVVAGHPPVLLQRATSGKQWLESIIPPLGLFTELPPAWAPLRLELAAEDRLIGYTDGIIETRDQSGAFFSLEALERVAMMSAVYDIESVPDSILHAVSNWRGLMRPVEDDMTVLALQLGG
jgi:phosphoserine phosphatase RsbU/P